MSSRETADFCLDCHWDAFDDMSGKFPMLPSDQWQCADTHHTGDAICNVEESCCADDNCSLNCSSVCDGFVDCDVASMACSDTHCESTGPACFENHCVDESPTVDNVTADLLQQTNFQWDPAVFLPSMVDHQLEIPVASSHLMNQQAARNQRCTMCHAFSDFHCHNSGHGSLNSSHQFSKDCTDLWCSPYTNQTDMSHNMSHIDMNNLLNSTSFYSTDPNTVFFDEQGEFAKMPCFQGDGQPSCSDAGFQHLGCYLRNSGDTRLLEFSKSQSKSRVHRHNHGQAHHRVSQYSRHPYSRKSISTQTISSFIDSPPSLDRAMSSALTSPTPGLPEEVDSHVCRWSYGPTTCSAIFASSGDLQQHLIAEHMHSIDGSKGHGYYCCWQGCHRPHEPFSQKSKLQGHFLTHSNYKNFTCSVCAKPFARQATLERHERSHRGEKPFKCKECGKAFTDSSELKTHSRTHTGEKPFKCTFPGCDFQTGDSSNMSSHKLTHSGRRHKCTHPGCTKSFTRPDQLKRHLKTTHKLNNNPPPINLEFTVPTQIGTVS